MSIFEQTASILSDLSGTKIISPDQNLQADLGLDSLQMVTLLILLEDHFGIFLDESDMNPFTLICVQNVADLVEKYVCPENNEETDKN